MMTSKNEGPNHGPGQPTATGSRSADLTNGPSAELDEDEPVQNALVDESDRLLHAVDEIKELETRKRRLRMSTPEFHQAAARIERTARQVFGIAKAQREVGEALQKQHDESIDDEARNADEDRRSAAAGQEQRR